MRRRRTPTQPAARAQQHATQQFDFEAYPAPGTDLKQAPPPAYEMHTAYPAPSQKQSEQAPPPPYEMQATLSPSYLTASSQRQSEQPQPPPMRCLYIVQVTQSLPLQADYLPLP